MDVDNDLKMLLFQLRWIWILNAHKHLQFVRTLSAVLVLPHTAHSKWIKTSKEVIRPSNTKQKAYMPDDSQRSVTNNCSICKMQLSLKLIQISFISKTKAMNCQQHFQVILLYTN